MIQKNNATKYIYFLTPFTSFLFFLSHSAGTAFFFLIVYTTPAATATMSKTAPPAIAIGTTAEEPLVSTDLTEPPLPDAFVVVAGVYAVVVAAVVVGYVVVVVDPYAVVVVVDPYVVVVVVVAVVVEVVYTVVVGTYFVVVVVVVVVGSSQHSSLVHSVHSLSWMGSIPYSHFSADHSAAHILGGGTITTLGRGSHRGYVHKQ